MAVRLVDVNILVYAYRTDSERHAEYRSWVEGMVGGNEAFAVSELVLSAFVRIVTNRRIYADPSTLERALTFTEEILSADGCHLVAPGDRHWSIFTGLCRSSHATGDRIPDAYLAALAIESGSEWITADRGFGRFPGLRWRHPLDG